MGKAITYDDFCNSTSFENFVDYGKRKENTINKISRLIESEPEEKKEERIENENNTFFKGCIYGMLVAFAIMLFTMNFIKELMF